MKTKTSLWFLSALLVLQTACGQRPGDTSVAPDAGTDVVAAPSGGAVTFGANGEVVTGSDPSLGAALESALTIHAISDTNAISTGGTDIANIKVLVTDDNNRAKSDETIEFSASGGVLQSIVPVTDANGEASAVLNLGRDYRNQQITVSAAAGGTEGSVQVSADGTEINISGQDLLIAGGIADLVMTLTAGNGEPISNEAVEFVSLAGNTITATSEMTDSNGQISFEVSSDMGSDTITATALDGTVSMTHDIGVASDILAFSSPLENEEISVGGIGEVTVRWESDGQAVVGEELRFSLTAGQIMGGSIVATDEQGIATVQITSSSAGPATVVVEANEGGDPAAQLEFEFIATTPDAVNLSASATRVPTGEASTLTAIVTDANGNPVKNTEVVFSSPDLRGGQINPASSISNSDGVATVTFTAGSLATEFEAIQVVSQIVNTSIVNDVLLTAVDRVLNVTIGTTDLIRTINEDTQYSLPFVVQVADGGGSPLEGASVELSVRPLNYSKGTYVQLNREGLTLEENNALNNGESFVADRWALRPEYVVTCAAEDANGNRLLDEGEDFNNNGSLDPQDPTVVAPDSVNSPTLEGGSITTDTTGSGFFAVIYPQSNARWAEVEITARAKALGAEADASFTTRLPVLASELNEIDSAMPNQWSPYGVSVTPDPAIDCANDL